MLNIIIERKRKSYDFKNDPKKPAGFDNNYKNNMQDIFVLFDDKAEIVRFRCQSVANYNFGKEATYSTFEWGDTIKEGYFTVKCFVEPRAFHGEIHGICDTQDVDGEKIDRNSMQLNVRGESVGRWLIHDKWSNSKNCESEYAWSSGCIILSCSDLECFNRLLRAYNIKPGDKIKGQIVEETVSVTP